MIIRIDTREGELLVNLDQLLYTFSTTSGNYELTFVNGRTLYLNLEEYQQIKRAIDSVQPKTHV